MTGASARVVFLPSGKRGRFAHGTPVLQAARELGVDVDSVCGGRGLCGRCQIECAEGDFAKHAIRSAAGHLSPRNETEVAYGRRRQCTLAAGRRLSCQARIEGDVVIDVPPESQMHRQLVRKDAEQREIVLDAATHLYYVEVASASMEAPAGDLQRVRAALREQWSLECEAHAPAALAALQSALIEGASRVTVAVRGGRLIAAAWPGIKRRIYGVALDIGSTTIAAHLCDLATGEVVASGGIMNPQIRFGEDLMSRVSYVMMHPDSAGALTVSVREGVRGLIAQVAEQAGVTPADVLEVTVAGNPIMHHLFLGLDPTPLGGAPFALATDEALHLPAPALELGVNEGAEVYVLPCVAGHVGADSAGVVLAEAPHLCDEVTLVVDVGTNAEIVLGNRERLFACSSPTGPAFEGAQISAGQRAAPGAIERVRIDPGTLDVRVRVIGSELWSDDPGFAASVARCGVTGICGSGIIEAVAQMYLAGVISRDGVIDGALAARSPRVVADGRTFSFVLREGAPRIVVTQNDVRQIQLAKAALYAGVRLLMDRAGVARVQAVRLAGAFGSHIDPRYAMALGLIPDCRLDKVIAAGNAAGTGARIALLNVAARREIEQVVRRIEKIETAVEPRFQAYFVEAMAFPHGSDPFPELFSVLARPPERAPAAARSKRRARRRRR